MKTMSENLNILYISQYFPPEVGATQTRAFEMARHLAAMGHRVTMLTEFPNHPRGIIPADYRGRFMTHERMHGFDVVRAWVYARPYKNFYTRMGFYLSFMLTASLIGSLLAGPFDIVYATSPPFFTGVAGLWLSRWKNARLVLELRDLWPQGAVELGELSDARLIRWAESLEKIYYRKALRIVVVTRGFEQALVSKGVDPDKIHFIPNGSNTSLFYDHGPSVKKLLGVRGKFVVLYAGILGIAQGMENLCELVQLCASHKDMHFVFMGEGPVRERVEQLKAERGLDNLSLLHEVPREKIAAYISAADVCLVPLKKVPLFTMTVPSKLFDYMACERPVVVSVDGEARRIVEESGAGIYVEPENVQDMKQALLRLKASPARREQMGKAGRAFVNRFYSRQQGARELEKIMSGLMP